MDNDAWAAAWAGVEGVLLRLEARIAELERLAARLAEAVGLPDDEREDQ